MNKRAVIFGMGALALAASACADVHVRDVHVHVPMQTTRIEHKTVNITAPAGGNTTIIYGENLPVYGTYPIHAPRHTQGHIQRPNRVHRRGYHHLPPPRPSSITIYQSQP